MTSIISKSPAYIAARNKLGDHRKVFDSIGEALETLKAIFASDGFPADFPVVAAQVGQVDISGDDTIPPLTEWPEAYHNGMVCVSFIGQRKLTDENGKATNGARGFAIYPMHSLDAVRAEQSGEDWLWKVAEKEASHVALRSLRNVPDGLGVDALAQAAMQMPVSVADFVEESTRESLDTSAFDAIWRTFRKMLSESPATAALVPMLPNKGEVLKSIRIKAYAVENYPKLEEIGAFVFIGDTMAQIIDDMRKSAIDAGEDFDFDSSEIRTWLAERDTKTWTAPRQAAADLSALNFAAFRQQVVGGESEEGASE